MAVLFLIYAHRKEIQTAITIHGVESNIAFRLFNLIVTKNNLKY